MGSNAGVQICPWCRWTIRSLSSWRRFRRIVWTVGLVLQPCALPRIWGTTSFSGAFKNYVRLHICLYQQSMGEYLARNIQSLPFLPQSRHITREGRSVTYALCASLQHISKPLREDGKYIITASSVLLSNVKGIQLNHICLLFMLYFPFVPQ